MAKSIVGIQIGSTSSSIGVLEGNKIKVATIPSCIDFSVDGLGKHADLLNLWPYHVFHRKNEQFGSLHLFSHLEIISMILMELKEIAERELGENVKVLDCVVSIPSSFNQSQRISTIEAAKIAGINILRLVNEIISSAIAYKLLNKSLASKDNKEESSQSFNEFKKFEEENILVCDLSGGSANFGVLKIGRDCKVFDVIAVEGDISISFDVAKDETMFNMISYYIEKFQKKHLQSVFLNQFKKEYPIKFICKNDYENDKRALREMNDPSRSIVWSVDEFKKADERSFSAFETLVQKCIKDGDFNVEVDQVVLAGGCSEISKIGVIFQKLRFWEFENPMFAVVHGATIMAANFSQLFISDSISMNMSLRVGFEGRVISNFVSKSVKVPYRKSFNTLTDANGVLKIEVYDSEIKEKLICSFVFRRVAPVGGKPQQVTVNFVVDCNGLITLSANGLPDPKMFHEEVSWDDVQEYWKDLEIEEQKEEEMQKKKEELRNLLNLNKKEYMTSVTLLDESDLQL